MAVHPTSGSAVPFPCQAGPDSFSHPVQLPPPETSKNNESISLTATDRPFGCPSPAQPQRRQVLPQHPVTAFPRTESVTTISSTRSVSRFEAAQATLCRSPSASACPSSLSSDDCLATKMKQELPPITIPARKGYPSFEIVTPPPLPTTPKKFIDLYSIHSVISSPSSPGTLDPSGSTSSTSFSDLSPCPPGDPRLDIPSSQNRPSDWFKVDPKKRTRTRSVLVRPKIRKPDSAPRVAIDPSVDLSRDELQDSLDLEVCDEDGRKVRFGDLWKNQRTCVVFTRHFLCPFCADYMRAIVREANPEVLEKAGVKLVVISHGSRHMIKSYRSIFNLPYPVYTDPSRKVFRALRMNIGTLSGGPKSERGDYLNHNLTVGLAVVAKNAVAHKMPLYRSPGNFLQIGGEFVLGPGFQCTYVSRMRNTATHAPVREVLSAAGVPLETSEITEQEAKAQEDELRLQEEQWMKVREAELLRIRVRREKRRGFASDSDGENSDYEDDLTEPL